MTDDNDTKDTSTSAPRWHVVAMLALALAASVVLGALGVLGEENTARLCLGVLALIASEVRRGPPPPAVAVGTALVAGEIGAGVLDHAQALAFALGGP